MSAEDAGRAIGDDGDVIDEDSAATTQVIDHIAVVDHLVANVDRRAIAFEHAFDDIDGTIDTGAEAAWIGKEYVHGGQGP